MGSHLEIEQTTMSDQQVPFIPECEVFYEGGPDSKTLYETCTKNPGHHGFIPVKDFKKKHLPPDPLIQSKDTMRLIRKLCDLTVKVIVKHTSLQRPDTYPGTSSPYPFHNLKGSKRASRTGTGYIYGPIISPPAVSERCPCPECVGSDHPKMQYWRLNVITASHVIYDNSEACKAVFELFYDDEKRKKVKQMYGMRVKGRVSTSYWEDMCNIQCVTHDQTVIKRLQRDNPEPLSYRWMIIMISHPHGSSKKISVGHSLHYTYKLHPEDPCTPCDSNDREMVPSPQSTESQRKIPPYLFKELDVRTIPRDSFITVPGDSDYLCQSTLDPIETFTFPPGTVITNSDGETEPLSPNSKFECGNIKALSHPEGFNILRFSTYDTPTCPGSSGAAVFQSVRYWWVKDGIHAGGLENGWNRCNSIVSNRCTSRDAELGPPSMERSTPKSRRNRTISRLY